MELVQISSKKKVYIRTYGCQMNVHDSDKLLKILDQEYIKTDQATEADLILVNTCSVRDKPEQKLYSFLGEMRAHKRQNPNLIIGVGGCVAQQEGNNIVERSDLVDFVFGTHNLSLVPGLIDQRKVTGQPQVAIDYRADWEDLPLGLSETGRVSVFISISRGCNKNCTYCIVPTTRGKEVSRNLAEIVREVKLSVHRGAKEVILLGQTVNSYGLDLNPRLKFVDLLEAVSAVDGLERIRFTSPHPQEVKPDFYDLVANNPKICRHIHMPLQSGSDLILKAMNRNYRRKKYLDIIHGLKQKAPDIAITTDIIVGFPGETEQDFEDTLDIIRQVRFDNTYSFMFSPRPGTVAAELGEQLSHEVKLERLSVLQSLQNQITQEILATYVGKQVEVLIDGPSTQDPQKMQGRISQNILVNFNKKHEELEPGMLVQAVISGTAKYTLKADYLSDSLS